MLPSAARKAKYYIILLIGTTTATLPTVVPGSFARLEGPSPRYSVRNYLSSNYNMFNRWRRRGSLPNYPYASYTFIDGVRTAQGFFFKGE